MEVECAHAETVIASYVVVLGVFAGMVNSEFFSNWERETRSEKDQVPMGALDFEAGISKASAKIVG